MSPLSSEENRHNSSLIEKVLKSKIGLWPLNMCLNLNRNQRGTYLKTQVKFGDKNKWSFGRLSITCLKKQLISD
jgi:hypothetical protein